MSISSTSLLIPCHNAESYLPRLHEMICKQSLPYSEVLFFDDGSTDGTAAIIRDFGYTIIESHTNATALGPGYARNRLADAASSDWIHFLDADDKFDPDFHLAISKEVSKDIDVVVSNVDWIDEISNKILVARKYSNRLFEKDAVTHTILNPIGVIGCIVRRNSFLDVGGFNEMLRCWEDGDLFVRLAISGARFTHLDRVLAYSIRHGRGISRDDKYCAQCRLEVLQDYAESLSNEYSSVLASELERSATHLLKFWDFSSAHQALSLCSSLGADPPTTHSKFLSFLKTFLPATAVLLIQQVIRRLPVWRYV